MDIDIPEDKRQDSKYRRYVAAVEKCLQSFESVNEWADVISFLTRLGKVFQSFPSFDSIPFKLNLAKRLAQCLNPALPAGVHHKTLEIYEVIFRKIGNAGLAKDLSVYSFGLFPFFEHSATLVKSSLLELYELYLIPLGVELRPSLRPLVLSIIPGLEEESSEHFGKVYELLNMIKNAAGTAEFYEALWTSLLISPRHRLAIVNFLLKSIPQGASIEELNEVCVGNRKLVARALASALGDRLQLVIRGTLDILLKYFPVNAGFFERKELVDLYEASMLVLMRKDMSLTRRFYNWVLITDPHTEQESLSDASLSILIDATKSLIENHNNSLDAVALPFKLLVFVLDKPIVADPLIKVCMFDLILVLLQKQHQIDGKIIPIANNLFRMLELDVIWSQLAEKLSRIDPKDSESALSFIKGVSFAIMHLSVCDESSLMIHLHLTINIVLTRLFKDFSAFSSSIASEMLELCLLLLAKLPLSTEATLNTVSSSEGVDELIAALIEGKPLPQDLSVDTVSTLVSCNVRLINENSHLFLPTIEEEVSVHIDVFSKASSALSLLLHRLRPNNQHLKALNYPAWIEALSTKIKTSSNDSVITCILKQLADHYSYWVVSESSIVRAALIDCLLPKLWKLIVNEGKDVASVAPLIARVCHIFPKEADVIFAKIISEAIRRQQTDALESFALLWSHCMNAQMLHSVPLRLSLTVMTESLCGAESVFRSRKCAFTWTFVLCQHLSVLLDPIMAGLADVIECGFNTGSNFGPRFSSLPSPMPSAVPKAFKASFDADEVAYYLDLLRSLLEVNTDGVMNFLQGHEVSPALLNQWLAFEDSLRSVLQVELGAVERRSYYNLILVLMVPLLLLDVPEDDGREGGVKSSVLQLMTLLGRAANRDSSVIFNVLIALSIDNLSAAVSRDVEKQTVLIGFFLDLFRGNEFIAGLFDRDDIVALGELCRKALRGVVDMEVVQCWTDFLLAIAFLPRSDVELIPAVLLDSVYLRLTVGLTGAAASEHRMGEALLTSLLSCVAKLTVFYFAAKTLPSASASNLKKSVSGLLSDTIREIIALAPSDARSAHIATNMNTGAIESVLFALLEVHSWLGENHMAAMVDGSEWSHCLIMLSDTCRQFYLMNQVTFTHFLIALFIKHHSSDKKYSFLAFFSMFYSGDGVEFLRGVWQYLKASKDSMIKQHDATVKIISVFAAGECDDLVNVELWNVLLAVIKEAVSSTYKYKQLYWTLLENVCLLLPKLNRIDSTRQAKDYDLLFKFFESCIVLTAKLHDQAQWTARPEETVTVASDRFTSVLLDSVKDRAIGRCVNSICRSLIPSMAKCFNDLEKLTAIMSLVIVNIVTPNFKSPLRSSLMGIIAAYCLHEAIVLNSNSLKPWRRELWEAFFDNTFLWMPKFYFSVMADAFRLIMADPDKYAEVLSRISASATASMFLSKDAEMLNKALMIRRLSFLTFWGSFDLFRLQLPSLNEKLVELTKYYNGLVLGEIFFLIRVMLLRLNDESMSALWPLIMTELVQVFESSIRSDALSYSDLYALFQACKLIDLMLTLRTGSILMYHWLFFDASGSGGLFLRLQHKLERLKNSSDSIASSAKAADSIASAKASYSVASASKEFDALSLSSSNRRPLLPVSGVKSPHELLQFLQSAKTHMSNDFIMIQEIDTDFINLMMENDLLEPLEVK